MSTNEKPVAAVIGVGASNGVGAAVARRFAREGFHLVLAGRTEGNLNAVRDEITSAGGSAESRITDATDEASIDGLIAHSDGVHGGLRAAISSRTMFNLPSVRPAATT